MPPTFSIQINPQKSTNICNNKQNCILLKNKNYIFLRMSTNLPLSSMRRRTGETELEINQKKFTKNMGSN